MSGGKRARKGNTSSSQSPVFCGVWGLHPCPKHRLTFARVAESRDPRDTQVFTSQEAGRSLRLPPTSAVTCGEVPAPSCSPPPPGSLLARPRAVTVHVPLRAPAETRGAE